MSGLHNKKVAHPCKDGDLVLVCIYPGSKLLWTSGKVVRLGVASADIELLELEDKVQFNAPEYLQGQCVIRDFRELIPIPTEATCAQIKALKCILNR